MGLLRVLTAATDCGFSDGCFACEGALTILAKPGAAAYDASLDPSGTFRTASGGCAGIPPGLGFVLRLVDRTYTPVLATPARRALREALQFPWER